MSGKFHLGWLTKSPPQATFFPVFFRGTNPNIKLACMSIKNLSPQVQECQKVWHHVSCQCGTCPVQLLQDFVLWDLTVVGTHNIKTRSKHGEAEVHWRAVLQRNKGVPLKLFCEEGLQKFQAVRLPKLVGAFHSHSVDALQDKAFGFLHSNGVNRWKERIWVLIVKAFALSSPISRSSCLCLMI